MEKSNTYIFTKNHFTIAIAQVRSTFDPNKKKHRVLFLLDLGTYDVYLLCFPILVDNRFGPGYTRVWDPVDRQDEYAH